MLTTHAYRENLNSGRDGFSGDWLLTNSSTRFSRVRTAVPDRSWIVCGIGLGLLIFTIDTMTPRGFADVTLYVLPVLAFWCGRSDKALLVFGALLPVLDLAGLMLSPPALDIHYVLANRLVSLGVIWLLIAFAHRELRQRAALAAADRAKSLFLAGMGHDLRQPLNAIVGRADAMAVEAFGPLGSERYRQYARDIHLSGVHLASILDNLAEFARIEFGQASPARTILVATELMESVAELTRPAAEARGVVVRTAVEPPDLGLIGDQRLLRMALLNLTSNALKYGHSGGMVEIRATAVKDTVRLEVRDDGPGIPLSEQCRLFQPFQRGAAAVASSVPGFGLGLALVARVAELSDGHIEFLSAPGKGTLVAIIVPAKVR